MPLQAERSGGQHRARQSLDRRWIKLAVWGWASVQAKLNFSKFNLNKNLDSYVLWFIINSQKIGFLNVSRLHDADGGEEGSTLRVYSTHAELSCSSSAKKGSCKHFLNWMTKQLHLRDEREVYCEYFLTQTNYEEEESHKDSGPLNLSTPLSWLKMQTEWNKLTV